MQVQAQFYVAEGAKISAVEGAKINVAGEQLVYNADQQQFQNETERPKTRRHKKVAEKPTDEANHTAQPVKPIEIPILHLFNPLPIEKKAGIGASAHSESATCPTNTQNRTLAASPKTAEPTYVLCERLAFIPATIAATRPSNRMRPINRPPPATPA